MRSLQIFKIWGIPFRIHPYWFAILFLFTWSISNQVNLTSGEIYNNKEAWLIGFLTSFFLLSTIIFHEVFHTFVSLSQGVIIKKNYLLFSWGYFANRKRLSNRFRKYKKPFSRDFKSTSYWIFRWR